MNRWWRVLRSTLIVCSICSDALGIYFPQKQYTAKVRVDAPVNHTIVKVYVLREQHEAKVNVRFQFNHIENNCSLSADSDNVQLFGIRPTSGWIFLRRKIPINSGSLGKNCRFIVTVKCTSNGVPLSVTTANVTIIVGRFQPRNPTNPCASMSPEIFCFGETKNRLRHLQIYEKSRPGPISKLSSDLRRQSCDRYSVVYSVHAVLNKQGTKQRKRIEVENAFGVNKSSGELYLKTLLHCNLTNIIKVGISCDIIGTQEGRKIKHIERTYQITLLKVRNMYGPSFSFRSSSVNFKQFTFDIDKQDDLTIIIFDKDLAKPRYNIYITDDPEDQFTVNNNTEPRYIMSGFYTIIGIVSLKRAWKLTTHNYTFSLVFEEIISEDVKQKRQAIARIIVVPPSHVDQNLTLKKEFAAVIADSAALYSQVISLNTKLYGTKDNVTFRLNSKDSPKTDLFGVTPYSGIVYVANKGAFRAWEKVGRGHIHLTIDMVVANKESHEIRVNITIIKAASTVKKCNLSCSLSERRDNCESSCGLGAIGGKCVWRSHSQTSEMTDSYTTCTPNTLTCPDAACDELESKYPFICPQDCTDKKALGPAKQDNEGGHFPIVRALGVCSCDTEGQCNCFRPLKEIGTKQTLPEASSHISSINGVHNSPGGYIATATPSMSGFGKRRDMDPSENSSYSASVCDDTCWTFVGVALSCLLTISLMATIAWHVCRYRKRKSAETKHVGSVMSLSAIPSDYVDSSRRPSNNLSSESAEWSPRFLDYRLHVDAKWEFPRKHLILDKTIGEGEFGRVVVAQAFNINGREGYSTVAVKMLKHCATAAEFRDIWSEYNLLKEVSHPNVIKLLGACTQRGPFYLIVEHCEHGSLRSYLRKCRQNDNIYMEPSAESPSADRTSNDEEYVTSRDLMSFSWQIAKGMQYLSEMKLVHRDLAARNVLIATRKAAKISDFGLTRDIYEGDAYMKKSKGRIPVKWMAPEALYEQTYTSKSDVWSYGVLLWEIVTLGATPYPGIPPERLYNLLKTGYRMERPENCSNQLFGLMEKCWRDSAIERPSFKELVDTFEAMLCTDVEYLDLGSAIEDYPIADDQEVDTNCVQENTGTEISEDADYGSVSVISMDDDSNISPTARAQTLPNPHIIFDKCGENGRQLHGSLSEMTKLLSTDRCNGAGSLKEQSDDQTDEDSLTMVTDLLLETVA